MRCRSLCIALVLLAAAAHAGAPLPNPAQEARAEAMFHELRCVVCQGESIADSSSDIAGDMRTRVRQMVAGGQTDDAIKALFVSRYGESVLMTPRIVPDTWILWFGPLAMLALGIAIVIAYFGAARIQKRG